MMRKEFLDKVGSLGRKLMGSKTDLRSPSVSRKADIPPPPPPKANQSRFFPPKASPISILKKTPGGGTVTRTDSGVSLSSYQSDELKLRSQGQPVERQDSQMSQQRQMIERNGSQQSLMDFQEDENRITARQRSCSVAGLWAGAGTPGTAMPPNGKNFNSQPQQNFGSLRRGFDGSNNSLSGPPKPSASNWDLPQSQMPFQPLHQAQSMAHVGCNTCNHGWNGGWDHHMHHHPMNYPQQYPWDMGMRRTPSTLSMPGRPGTDMLMPGAWHQPPPMMYPMHPGYMMPPGGQNMQQPTDARAPSPATSHRSRNSHKSHRRPASSTKWRAPESSDSEIDDFKSKKSGRSSRHRRQTESSDDIDEVPPRERQSIDRERARRERESLEIDRSRHDRPDSPRQKQKHRSEALRAEKFESPATADSPCAWGCPHCTFMNDATDKICAICCKSRPVDEKKRRFKRKEEREKSRSRASSLKGSKQASPQSSDVSDDEVNLPVVQSNLSFKISSKSTPVVTTSPAPPIKDTNGPTRSPVDEARTQPNSATRSPREVLKPVPIIIESTSDQEINHETKISDKQESIQIPLNSGKSTPDRRDTSFLRQYLEKSLFGNQPKNRTVSESSCEEIKEIFKNMRGDEIEDFFSPVLPVETDDRGDYETVAQSFHEIDKKPLLIDEFDPGNSCADTLRDMQSALASEIVDDTSLSGFEVDKKESKRFSRVLESPENAINFDDFPVLDYLPPMSAVFSERETSEFEPRFIKADEVKITNPLPPKNAAPSIESKPEMATLTNQKIDEESIPPVSKISIPWEGNLTPEQNNVAVKPDSSSSSDFQASGTDTIPSDISSLKKLVSTVHTQLRDSVEDSIDSSDESASSVESDVVEMDPPVAEASQKVKSVQSVTSLNRGFENLVEKGGIKPANGYSSTDQKASMIQNEDVAATKVNNIVEVNKAHPPKSIADIELGRPAIELPTPSSQPKSQSETTLIVTSGTVSVTTEAASTITRKTPATAVVSFDASHESTRTGTTAIAAENASTPTETASASTEIASTGIASTSTGMASTVTGMTPTATGMASSAIETASTSTGTTCTSTETQYSSTGTDTDENVAFRQTSSFSETSQAVYENGTETGDYWEREKAKMVKIGVPAPKKTMTSTGTSPLPQSISTQTYEDVEMPEIPPSPKPIRRPSRDEESRLTSYPSPQPRRLSRGISLDDNGRAGMHYVDPMGYHSGYEMKARSLSREGSPHRGRSETPDRRYPHHPPPFDPWSRGSTSTWDLRSVEDQRDWRRGGQWEEPGYPWDYGGYSSSSRYKGSTGSLTSYGTSTSGLVSSRDSRSETDSIFNGFEDVSTSAVSGFQQRRPPDLTDLLREAANEGFGPDDVRISLGQCGTTHPIDWLRNNWTTMIDKIVVKATKYGQKQTRNTVGAISRQEAVASLRRQKGNVQMAIQSCIKQRQKKYVALATKGNFSHEDIVTSLTAAKGDVNEALAELQGGPVESEADSKWSSTTADMTLKPDKKRRKPKSRETKRQGSEDKSSRSSFGSEMSETESLRPGTSMSTASSSVISVSGTLVPDDTDIQDDDWDFDQTTADFDMTSYSAQTGFSSLPPSSLASVGRRRHHSSGGGTVPPSIPLDGTVSVGARMMADLAQSSFERRNSGKFAQSMASTSSSGKETMRSSVVDDKKSLSASRRSSMSGDGSVVSHQKELTYQNMQEFNNQSSDAVKAKSQISSMNSDVVFSESKTGAPPLFVSKDQSQTFSSNQNTSNNQETQPQLPAPASEPISAAYQNQSAASQPVLAAYLNQSPASELVPAAYCNQSTASEPVPSASHNQSPASEPVPATYRNQSAAAEPGEVDDLARPKDSFCDDEEIDFIDDSDEDIILTRDYSPVDFTKLLDVAGSSLEIANPSHIKSLDVIPSHLGLQEQNSAPNSKPVENDESEPSGSVVPVKSSTLAPSLEQDRSLSEGREKLISEKGPTSVGIKPDVVLQEVEDKSPEFTLDHQPLHIDESPVVLPSLVALDHGDQERHHNGGMETGVIQVVPFERQPSTEDFEELSEEEAYLSPLRSSASESASVATNKKLSGSNSVVNSKKDSAQLSASASAGNSKKDKGDSDKLSSSSGNGNSKECSSKVNASSSVAKSKKDDSDSAILNDSAGRSKKTADSTKSAVPSSPKKENSAKDPSPVKLRSSSADRRKRNSTVSLTANDAIDFILQKLDTDLTGQDIQEVKSNPAIATSNVSERKNGTPDIKKSPIMPQIKTDPQRSSGMNNHRLKSDSPSPIVLRKKSLPPITPMQRTPSPRGTGSLRPSPVKSMRLSKKDSLEVPDYREFSKSPVNDNTDNSAIDELPDDSDSNALPPLIEYQEAGIPEPIPGIGIIPLDIPTVSLAKILQNEMEVGEDLFLEAHQSESEENLSERKESLHMVKIEAGDEELDDRENMIGENHGGENLSPILEKLETSIKDDLDKQDSQHLPACSEAVEEDKPSQTVSDPSIKAEGNRLIRQSTSSHDDTSHDSDAESNDSFDSQIDISKSIEYDDVGAPSLFDHGLEPFNAGDFDSEDQVEIVSVNGENGFKRLKISAARLLSARLSRIMTTDVGESFRPGSASPLAEERSHGSDHKFTLSRTEELLQSFADDDRGNESEAVNLSADLESALKRAGLEEADNSLRVIEPELSGMDRLRSEISTYKQRTGHLLKASPPPEMNEQHIVTSQDEPAATSRDQLFDNSSLELNVASIPSSSNYTEGSAGQVEASEVGGSKKSPPRISSAVEEVVQALEAASAQKSPPKSPPLRKAEKAKDSASLLWRLIEEGRVPNVEKAQLAAHLVDLRFEEEEAVEAALECNSIYSALSYLRQECELCATKYPAKEMVSMLNCIHRCCRSCAGAYFSTQIRDGPILELVCPFCREPSFNEILDEEANEYFMHLEIMLKGLLERPVFDLYERKLRDWTLSKDPNFWWCHKCSSGFFIDPSQSRHICPDCSAVTCAGCRKPWRTEHDRMTCPQYVKFLAEEELETLDTVAKLLAEGIQCPKCSVQYALARGGCMHFTCTQCKYEFCSGCGKPFKMGARCDVGPRCARLGLHAHHPRNCLFYLRDKEPQELQKLLRDNSVHFDIDGPIYDNPTNLRRCKVQIQKETPRGFEDDVCNGDIEEGFAGLCRTHYIEYLAGLVARSRVDPVSILDSSELMAELRRACLDPPEREPGEPDRSFYAKVAQLIQQEIPL